MPPHSPIHIPHSAFLLLLALSSVLGPLSSASAQDDPFAAGVRTTPWQSPADEQKAFKLPPGFEIQLVAAEPDIQKPLNMAFDERGRIWLTCSVEYPYAAPPDRKGRDSIRVLEDTDGDGRFETVRVFADGLNIPMGIYPWKDGCIAFSIPNIWHFEDTDGDGVCDKRKVLYGPFDTSRDTHGMVNSFRRGWDGWLYACHGFNNDSRVKGKDGHEVHMQSGNTFRFKLDGSRIEHFTHGQVNPFGMCFDELFNIFTADCHSKPIYQLLRGGYYPSFGKPHDGLGFVPPMMDHTHGSTAICGLAYCDSENFPREYSGDLFSGNVMTSRVNRNKIEFHGSTAKAIEQPDFLVSDDPWFRPVDIHFGADRAMYILDFYNRIIGHYEVPLTHPGRDKTSGRIWRVVYTKPDNRETFTAEQREDLRKFDAAELVQSFGERNDRLPALNLLCDGGRDCIPQIQEAWTNPSNSQNENLHILWALERFGELSDAILREAMNHESRWETTHLMRILAERQEWNELQRAMALRGLASGDPFVARTAADAIGRHPTPGQLLPLLARLHAAPSDDTHLRHSLRLALRDHVAALQSPETIQALELTVKDRQELASVCVAVPSATAAALLVEHVESQPSEVSLAHVQHAARYAAGEASEHLISVSRKKYGANIELQSQVVLALTNGLAQRNERAGQQLIEWGEDVVRQLLTDNGSEPIGWTAIPIDGQPPSENPWVIAPRPSGDGDKDSLFYYSLPKGEQQTGIYRSGAFAIPEKLSFWCAGHSGFPGQPLNDGNYVRLRDAATHAVLAESRPPRNDTARRFEWDLSEFVEQDAAPSPPAPLPRGERGEKAHMGYVELVDGDTANAYAWLAVGRFSLDSLNPGQEAARQQLAAEIISKLKLAAFKPQLATLVASPNTDGAARAAMGAALVALEPDSRAAALVAALNDPSIPGEMRPRLGYAITVDTDQEYLDNLREVMKRAPSRLQTLVAETLAGDATGADALLVLVESGHASPRLLLASNVSSKFASLKSDALDQRVATITARLPAASETLDRLILERRLTFAKASPDLTRGRAVFEKHCIACHQLDGKGVVIGPQLDGIGSRGLDRLIEDLLDPNRNVDVAFQTTTLRLADGRVVSGLVRREEGEQLVLADNQGKEFSIAKREIDEQQKTPLSLMPANVGEIASAEEFCDLVGYLLTKRASQN